MKRLVTVPTLISRALTRNHAPYGEREGSVPGCDTLTTTIGHVTNASKSVVIRSRDLWERITNSLPSGHVTYGSSKLTAPIGQPFYKPVTNPHHRDLAASVLTSVSAAFVSCATIGHVTYVPLYVTYVPSRRSRDLCAALGDLFACLEGLFRAKQFVSSAQGAR